MNNNNNTAKYSESKKSDFSIEHILTKAGNGTKNNSETFEYQNTQNDGYMSFSWLQCTRYSPPKLPRSQKKDGPQKRQLGRHPRIPFSSQQLAVLEDKFKHSPYLSSAEVIQLSRTLQLADIRVKIWFQNRRARERREKQEHEVQQLKPYKKEAKQNISTTDNSVTTLPTATILQNEPYYTFIQHSTQNYNTLPLLLNPETHKNKSFGNLQCYVTQNKL